MTVRRCNGAKRYGRHCRNATSDPSGLCHLHRHQTAADIRTDSGRWLCEHHEYPNDREMT